MEKKREERAERREERGVRKIPSGSRRTIMASENSPLLTIEWRSNGEEASSAKVNDISLMDAREIRNLGSGF